MIHLSLEGRNDIGIWEKSSRQRVPKPRVRSKEAVTVTLDTRVGQFYTISIGGNSLARTTGAW